MKKTGNREAVWAGTAQQTSGGLTKTDLKRNPAGKLVSVRVSANSKKSAAANLTSATRRAGTSARAPASSHSHGMKAGKQLRELHGSGLLGSVLGGILGPIINTVIPGSGKVVSALGGLIPI